MKIDVFLLAAGESSRMFPLSQIMEKSLLPVDGKPVIRIIVENLSQLEVAKHIKSITICCLSKFKKQFEHEFRDIPSIKFKIFQEPVGTVSTLYQAIEEADIAYDKNVLVHYADSMTDIDYEKFLRNEPYCNALLAVNDSLKIDYSVIKTFDHAKQRKRVDALYEKPSIDYFNTNDKKSTSRVYSWIGVALFSIGYFMGHSDKLRDTIGYLENTDIATDILPMMVDDGVLECWRHNGYYYDVGNLNSYRKICQKFMEK